MTTIIMNSSSHVQSLFNQLKSSSSSNRLAIICSIRKFLRRNSMIMCHETCFYELSQILLTDKRECIQIECMMTIMDMIPNIGIQLDECMSHVTPTIIANLANDSIQVKRTSLKLLHVYMRHTNNLQKVLRLLCEHGLNSKNIQIQKSVILSIPLLFSHEFSHENLFILIQCLFDLLHEQQLFYAVFLAIKNLNLIIGENYFKFYLNRIDAESVRIYQNLLNTNSGTNDSS